jgi:hypothetical protein
VPVEKDDTLKDDQTGDLISIRPAMGDLIPFEQKRERYFIDEREKASVFNQMVESFRSSTRNYLAHPQFPSRFVTKAFRKYLEKKRLNELINTDRDK